MIPEEDEVCDASRVAKEEENAKSFQLSGFMIHCWETGNRESTLIQRSTSDKSIELHHLNNGSLYSIQVRVVYTDSTGSKFFSSPAILQARTLQVAERPAHIVRRVSRKSSGSSVIDTNNLLLKKVNDDKIQGVGHYVFGEKSVMALAGKHRKRTILMVGATGTGKSTNQRIGQLHAGN